MHPENPNRTNLTPVQVVQRQVEAYNRRDLEAFLSFYHPDTQIFDQGSDQPSHSGINEMRALYGTLFMESPQLHGKILNRIAQSQYVIDQEEVTGIRNGPPLFATAIYQVRDGLICMVWFIK